jgi:membrane-associated phospholipid phosphatase
MTRRPLLIAVACAVLGAIVYLLSTRVPAVEAADARTLNGFMGLWALPGAGRWSNVAGLFDPRPYAVLMAGVLVGGWLAGRPRAGVLAVAAMCCAGATSQILKPLLAVHRDSQVVEAASWPSGHSTGAMAFALALVLIAPPRLRALAGAGGGLLVIATVYVLMMRGAHYPSDVLGGLLNATGWMALALIPLRAEVRLSLRGPALGAAVFGVAVALAVAMTPGRAAAYAAANTTFVFGALAIAAAALVLSGSVLAPTGARPRRPLGSPPGRG